MSDVTMTVKPSRTLDDNTEAVLTKAGIRGVDAPSVRRPVHAPSVMTDLDVVAAGKDPETGWPFLELEQTGDWGRPGIPRQRYVLTHEVARKLAIDLLAAADPDLVADLLRQKK